MLKSWTLRALSLMAIILAFGFLVTNAMWSRTSEQSATGKPKDLPAEEFYQNIQVLKGIPSSQVSPIMRLMSASLGVECSECHHPFDHDKDIKPSKQIARKMLRMVFEINRANFNGRPQVTCNTCHRGQKQPVSTPDVVQARRKPIPNTSQTPLPAIEKIIDQYVRAVGGRARFENFKGCIIKGFVIEQNMPIEISQVEPDRMSITFGAPKAPDAKSFATRPIGLYRSAGRPSEMKRYEYLIHPIRFVEGHRNPRIIGKTKLGESEAYEVVASADGLTAKLFFDARNGLLLRRVVNIKNTVIGPLQEQSDFEDYRDVDGVKLPFVTRQGSTTLKLIDVKHDISAKGENLDPNTKIKR